MSEWLSTSMDSGLRALGYRDVGVGSQSRYLVEADILVISFHRRKHTKLRFRVDACWGLWDVPTVRGFSGAALCQFSVRW